MGLHWKIWCEYHKRGIMEFNQPTHPTQNTKKNHLYGTGIAVLLCILLVGWVGCETNQNPVLESCVRHEEGGIHFHVSLVTVHNKQPQMLPGGIGITPDCMRPIHTHAEDFMIHVEYNEPFQFTMGNFFEVWGDDNPYINSEVVTISLNGKIYMENYRELILEDGQNVVIEFVN